jgi:hypothetical protein
MKPEDNRKNVKNKRPRSKTKKKNQNLENFLMEKLLLNINQIN